MKNINIKKIKTTCLLFTSAIIWGFSFVAQAKGAGSGIGAFTFNAVKMIIGALSMIPVILIFDKKENKNKSKKKIKPLIISSVSAGFLLFLASFMQQYAITVGIKSGVKNITGVAGFITGTYIVIVPIIRAFSKKKTPINTWLGAVFAVFGLYFLCVTNDLGSITQAHIYLMFCSVFFAVHIIVIDKFTSEVSAVKFSFLQFAVAAALSLICAFLFEEPAFEQIKLSIIPLLYSGILSVGVAYTCQTIAQREADPTFAGIVFSTESVFSAVGGAIIMHEIMTGKGYLGCALIFTGIIISQLEFKKKQS